MATSAAKVNISIFKPPSLHTNNALCAAVPSIPCSDFSGRVLRAGSGVTKVAVGDYVAGCGKGCAAHFCVVADTNVVKLSNSGNLKMACAAGVAALTASECVRKGEVAAGSTVVVIGASGGVGHIVVQMAKNLGACVIAICRHTFCTVHLRTTTLTRWQYLQRAICASPWRRHRTPVRCWTQLRLRRRSQRPSHRRRH